MRPNGARYWQCIYTLIGCFIVVGSIAVAQESKPPGSESLAEQIARLKRTIAEDERLLRELQQQLQDPESSYHRAERLFEQLDKQRAELLDRLEQAKKAKDEADQKVVEEQLATVEKQWKLAKAAFEAEIKKRKLLQERLANLEKKLAADRAALRQLTGEPPQIDQEPSQGPEMADTGQSDASREQRADRSDSSKVSTAERSLPPAETPAGRRGAEKPAPTSTAEQAVRELDEGLSELRERVQSLRKQLDVTRTQLRTTQRALEQEEAAYAATRTSHANALNTLLTLQRELREQVGKRAGETDPERLAVLDRQIQQLSAQLTAAEEQVKRTREDLAAHEERINRMRDELARLQAREEQLGRDLDAATQALQEQELKAYWLHKLVQLLGIKDWLWEHGPRLLGILVGALLLWWLVRITERRLTYVVMQAARAEEEDEEERLNRARTLTGFFRHVAGLVILGGAAVLILGELGVNLNVMLGGAAITGLAAAFAGQNLLRDYFSGFVILLENQYGINDVVKIGDVAGIVEKVTLRLTILRALDGTVHFIPNGQIGSVSNMTHGWSRALFDIEVSYREDLDRVMAVLLELARELRQDPEYGPLILDEPEMLGVDEFRASGISIKFYLKTKPLRQWAVKRELNRRIKRKFDELGIEIPYPHRTVYHRLEDAEPSLQRLAEALRRSADA